MERHLATVWESLADAVGDTDALVQGSRRITWSQFDDRAARLAAALRGAGLETGSRVAQFLYNSPEYAESYAAALKQRMVPINVNYRYLDEELRYLLADSGAQALVFHAALADRVARVAPSLPDLRLLVQVDDSSGAPLTEGAVAYEVLVAAHEPAARMSRDPDDRTMFYTGGTTGMPKGVLGRVGPGVDVALTAVPASVGIPALQAPEEIAPAARRLADNGRQIVALPACPLMHGTGLSIGFLPAFTFGGRAAFAESRGLDTDEIWGIVEREGVQSLTFVGDAFARPLLRTLDDGPPRDLSSLRLMMSSGAMFSAEVKAGLLEHAPNAVIVDYIAATEGAMGASISMRGNIAPTGRFTPLPHVKVVDADGNRVEPGSGVVGVVVIGGAGPDGYHNDAAKSAATFPEIDGQRVAVLGDHATIEADGSIALLGRGSQCINTGGEKVFAEEVEEALKRHAGVDDCLVIGVDDERFGQRVVAVASRAPATAASVDEVIAATRDLLAGYKVPRDLVWVDSVPRAPNGKADYRGARRAFDDGSRH